MPDRAHKPLHVRETDEAHTFAVEMAIDDALAFGVKPGALGCVWPGESLALSNTENGPALARKNGLQPVLSVSLTEALAYAHQIGRQLGLGDRVLAYTAVHRHADRGGVEAPPSMKRHHRLKDHALVRVGVGDIVRWGKDRHVGRVKEIVEGGRVAVVRPRGSDARMPVPIYDLAVVLPARQPTAEGSQPPARRKSALVRIAEGAPA